MYQRNKPGKGLEKASQKPPARHRRADASSFAAFEIETKASSPSKWRAFPVLLKILGRGKGQVSLEYLFLLALIGVAIIIVLASQQPLFSQQKEIHAGLSSLLQNVTNSTFNSLGGQQGEIKNATSQGLLIEADAPGPYFSGQPGIFWVTIWNRDSSPVQSARISVSVKDAQNQNVFVGPPMPDNATIVYSRTFSQQFSSNSTGSHIIIVTATDQTGLIIATSSTSFWVG